LEDSFKEIYSALKEAPVYAYEPGGMEKLRVKSHVFEALGRLEK
jgi:hypothetical protein